MVHTFPLLLHKLSTQILLLSFQALGIAQASLTFVFLLRTSAIFKQAWLRLALSRLGIIQTSLASALAAPELDIALGLASVGFCARLAKRSSHVFTLLSIYRNSSVSGNSLSSQSERQKPQTSPSRDNRDGRTPRPNRRAFHQYSLLARHQCLRHSL